MNDGKIKKDHAREYAIQKTERYTYSDFKKEYGNSDKLLEYIWSVKYGRMNACPQCKKHAKYTRIKKRTQWQCSSCQHCITPLKGTMFYRSHVPLSMWFYAIYLFSINKNGMSAKELERVLGIEYRTAHSMFHKIIPLVAGENYHTYFESGTAEIDDRYFGGKIANTHASAQQATREKGAKP